MIKTINPPNVGWLEKKLSDREMDYLWKCIDNRKGDYRKELAGHISGSNLLLDRGDWFFLNTLKPLLERYKKDFYNIGHHGCSHTHPYMLGSWWVNYQKQTEFNPGHTHGGVYSFVIWMKIPTHYKDQRKLPISAKSNSETCISNFQFEYIDIVGNIKCWEYNMSPEKEGTMVFFPAKLLHQVFPFYNCDEERISISGNLILNTAKRL